MRNKFQITMEDKIKINYPDSEKVYMPGSLYPELRVGMRRVRLTPTVVVKDGEKVLTCTSTIPAGHTATRLCR